jgi:hypothetical protein
MNTHIQNANTLPRPNRLQAELAADVIAELPIVELVRGVVARLPAKVYDPGVGTAAQQLLDQQLVALSKTKLILSPFFNPYLG